MSGESLDLLKVFFNILPPLSNSKEQEELMQQLTEFQVQFTLNTSSDVITNGLKLFLKDFILKIVIIPHLYY